MSDRPILFSAPMVRAILAGRKTQTRRVIKPVGDSVAGEMWPSYFNGKRIGDTSEKPQITEFEVVDGSTKFGGPTPYTPGDRLWVKETWRTESHYYNDLSPSEMGGEETILYETDATGSGNKSIGRLRASMHMPRWASRITLIVTNVRVERLQDINRGDAMEEGCPFPNMADGDNPRDWFRELWDSLNSERGYGWDANPWVVAISFTPVFANIDEVI